MIKQRIIITTIISTITIEMSIITEGINNMEIKEDTIIIIMMTTMEIKIIITKAITIKETTINLRLYKK